MNENEKKMTSDFSVPKLITGILGGIGTHKLMAGLEKEVLKNTTVGALGAIGIGVVHVTAVLIGFGKCSFLGDMFQQATEKCTSQEEEDQEEDA